MAAHEHDHSEHTGPALNYCPQCGTLLEDRLAFGQIRRYCGICKRVVFREHKVAVAVLITNAEREILLVRRALPPHQGAWSLPAGYVDYGESPADAGRRECQEETGLTIEIGQVVDVTSGREQGNGAHIVIVYEGRVIGGKLQAADDADAARFFSRADLPELAFASTHQAVARWCEQPATEERSSPKGAMA